MFRRRPDLGGEAGCGMKDGCKMFPGSASGTGQVEFSAGEDGICGVHCM